MNVQKYLARRSELAVLDGKIPRRNICGQCLQPDFSCYCAHVQKFDPKMKFVILTHPIEAKRRIATGRMAYLCLEDAEFVVGHDYSNNKRVNEILNSEEFKPLILYPGPTSVNLSQQTAEQRAALFPGPQKLAIFVIDGTWATARQTARLSRNLHQIQRISFVPSKPSNFRVRQQPAPGCYSTIEAIHETIGLLGDGRGFATESKGHDHLLYVFDTLVEHQLQYVPQNHAHPRTASRQRLRIDGIPSNKLQELHSPALDSRA